MSVSVSDSDPIVAVAAELVHKRLPRELRLGAFTLDERIYAMIRIETASGLVGHSYAQTRGAPVVEVVLRLLAPRLLGKDSASIGARWRDCFEATMGVGRTGLIMRALSLVDIALWDAQGQRAGLPLYRLLGGGRAAVPTMFVAGYPRSLDDVEETVTAAYEAASNGFTLLKIAKASDPVVTRTILQELEGGLPNDVRVVVDGSWAWQSPYHAMRELGAWPLHRIAWVEDPFPPESPEAFAVLGRIAGVAIGAGDEVTDPHVLQALALQGGVGMLRLDVATIGGVTGAVRVLHRAEAWGVPISFHISTEVSAHLAGAFSIVDSIETFDRAGNRFDPSHELYDGGPSIADGLTRLGSSPGLGLSPRV